MEDVQNKQNLKNLTIIDEVQSEDNMMNPKHEDVVEKISSDEGMLIEHQIIDSDEDEDQIDRNDSDKEDIIEGGISKNTIKVIDDLDSEDNN